MNIAKIKGFTKGYQRLPAHIQKKIDKQLRLLSQNLRYPSLRTKKLEGIDNVWEGRVDRFYRFIFKYYYSDTDWSS